MRHGSINFFVSFYSFNVVSGTFLFALFSDEQQLIRNCVSHTPETYSNMSKAIGIDLGTTYS